MSSRSIVQEQPGHGVGSRRNRLPRRRRGSLLIYDLLAAVGVVYLHKNMYIYVGIYTPSVVQSCAKRPEFCGQFCLRAKPPPSSWSLTDGPPGSVL